MDIVLKASVIAYYDQHDIVTDRQSIFKQYTKSWRFQCHVIASLPLDLLYFTGSIGNSVFSLWKGNSVFLKVFTSFKTGNLGPAQTLSVYRVGKLVRLVELQRLLELLFSCSLKQSIQRRTLCKLHGDATVKNFLRLAKLIMAILMIAFFTGTLYFLIASQVCLYSLFCLLSAFFTDYGIQIQMHLRNNENNWASVAGILSTCSSYSHHHDVSSPSSNASMTTTYGLESPSSCAPTREVMLTQGIYSMYWAITVLTTTGYGDITPVSELERVFNIVVFVMGILMYATVIAHMEDIVSQLDVTKKIFTKKINRIQGFLKREGCTSNIDAIHR